jgi:hypothetical protein
MEPLADGSADGFRIETTAGAGGQAGQAGRMGTPSDGRRVDVMTCGAAGFRIETTAGAGG